MSTYKKCMQCGKDSFYLSLFYQCLRCGFIVCSQCNPTTSNKYQHCGSLEVRVIK